MKVFKISAYAFALILSFAGFFTIFFYLIENNENLNEEIKRVNHTHNVIHASKSIQYQLISVESASRTYFLTGRATELEQVNKGWPQIDTQISVLKESVNDNLRQKQNIQEMIALIDQRKKLMKLAFSSFGINKNNTNSALIELNLQGVKIASQIKDVFLKIEKIEFDLLKRRTERLDSAQKKTIFYNILAGACSVCLAFFTAGKLIQHIRVLRRAQKQLQEKEQKLSIIYNSTSDALFLIDPQTFKIIDCNQKAQSLFRYEDKQDLVEKHFFTLEQYVPDFQKIELIQKVLQDSRIWEKEVVYQDKKGDTFWGDLSISNTLLDGKEWVIARIIDITKRKFIEREIQETGKILNGMLESFPVLVYKVNADGIITSSKGRGLEKIGLKEARLIGAHVHEAFPQFKEDIKNGSEENSSVFTSFGYVAEKPYFFEHYTFKDADNEKGIIGFALEVTANKLAEKEMFKAKLKAEKAARARQKFLSTMSHEIRTPLNAIIGMTHLMLKDKVSEQQQQRLNILKFSGENLLHTLNEILDLSKIESGGIEFSHSDFHLQDVIQNIKTSFETLADKKEVGLELDLGSNLPLHIKGDSHRLQQVLNNLLNNALKFTDKGSITLGVYVEGEEEDKIRLAFYVKDTGIGIPKEKQASIFEPFKQAESDTSRKYGGTGLGLAIIKNIVELQGGRIELESKIGEGSTFKVFITYEKSALLEKEEKTEDELSSLRGVKVLYVDDVQINQLLLEGFCGLWNVDLETASSGQEALEKVQKRKYDLILMDIQMPEMDGYETTRRIREIEGEYFASVPIVALSAEVSENIKKQITKSGMDGYLYKPVNPEELHGTIQKYTPEKADRTVSEGRLNYQIQNGSTIVSFETLDKLFINQSQEYIHFLYSITVDFSKYFKEIKSSVKKGEVENYNSTRHKLLSLLKIMKTDQLLQVLDYVKEELEAGAVLETENVVDEINYAFDLVVEGIEEKMEELKES